MNAVGLDPAFVLGSRSLSSDASKVVVVLWQTVSVVVLCSSGDSRVDASYLHLPGRERPVRRRSLSSVLGHDRLDILDACLSRRIKVRLEFCTLFGKEHTVRVQLAGERRFEGSLLKI